MNDNYTIKDKILTNNDKPCVCPKSPPFIVPNKIQGGHASVERMNCNEHCPFFQHAEVTKGDDKKKGVVLQCMEKPRVIVLADS